MGSIVVEGYGFVGEGLRSHQSNLHSYKVGEGGLRTIYCLLMMVYYFSKLQYMRLKISKTFLDVLNRSRFVV